MSDFKQSLKSSQRLVHSLLKPLKGSIQKTQSLKPVFKVNQLKCVLSQSINIAYFTFGED